jgi:hypothetical protein
VELAEFSMKQFPTEPELQLVIDRLKLRLPPQPPPRITTAAVNQARRRSEDLLT